MTRMVAYVTLTACMFVLFAFIHPADASSNVSKKVCGDRLCSEVKPCIDGQIQSKIDKKCYIGSTGWKITGYFLPLEKDYPRDSFVSVYVAGKTPNGTFDYIENHSTYYLKKFRSTFLNEVITQGAGKTNDGKILQTWQNDIINPNGKKARFYHYEKCALTFSGVCLPSAETSLSQPLIMVAVTAGDTDIEKGIISHGSLLQIPNIPSPWNTKTYWATDVGEWNDKHIDIFTGYGMTARDAAFKITKLPPNESSSVLVVGFKQALP